MSTESGSFLNDTKVRHYSRVLSAMLRAGVGAI